MLSAVTTVIKENWTNRYRLVRLANYDLKQHNRGTVLGFLWNFLNPILQILVYWFVFAIGLNTSPPRGEYSYIIWMIVGVIPWFYISNALMSSTICIHGYSGIITYMYLPLSIIPVKTVLSELFGHFWSMLVVIALFLMGGYHLTWHAVFLLYYAFCSFSFLVAYALLASAITVLFRDFQHLMSSVVRLLFYLSPAVWSQEGLQENLQFVLRLNPFAYILEGYRESILYAGNPIWHWKQGIYFWAVTLILFVLGGVTHMKFRRKFIDLI